MVTHKTELEVIDGTPEKRSFLSLISDYNLKIGIFELVDNAIDFWTRGGATSTLGVDIVLDPDRQVLCVRDNAGGVQRKDVRLLISPGATGNPANVDVIGIFGVGGKRAAVALGERVEIKTRFKKEKSLQIDLTSDWLLESDEWTLPVYEIPDITPGCTIVDVSKLRQSFNADDVDLIRIAQHFERTVIQRLGYLLELLGHNELTRPLEEYLRNTFKPSWVMLEPKNRKQPAIEIEPLVRSERWHIVVYRYPEIDE